jgi:hypothetical protein
MPFTSFAGTGEGEPCSDCPKKKQSQSQEDSVGIYESENKVLDDVQIQYYPKKRTPIKKTTKKTSLKTYDHNLDESDKVAEEDPNSAMSFNIIYYIIDKFKFTDPLE